MSVYSKTYKGEAGSYTITDTALKTVTILGVKRSGIGHDPTNTPPTGSGRLFQYVQSDGSIVFSSDQPFAGPPITTSDDVYEYIFVLWKT